MSISHLHWVFEQRFNRLASNHLVDLSPMQKDQFLNDGMFQLLQDIFDKEQASRFTDLVAALVVDYPEQPEIEPDDTVSEGDFNRYEFRFSSLIHDYYHYKRAVINTDCGLVKVVIEPYGRLSDILNDHLQRPSKRWSRAIGYVGRSTDGAGSALFVYTEDTHIVSGLRLQYVKKPKKAFFGGYDTLEYLDCRAAGNADCSAYLSANSTRQAPDIDEQFYTLIVDRAVEEALRSLQDVNGFQLQVEKTRNI